jgi:hypothetical protein
MRSCLSRSIRGAFVLGIGLAMPGCGNGVDESDITSTALPPPADAPKTPAEYDAKYPVANAGDAPKAKRGGPAVTNP